MMKKPLNFSCLLEILRRYGLNVSDLAALSALVENGSHSNNELRRATGLSVPANYALLTRLKEGGFIKSEKTEKVIKFTATKSAGQVLQKVTESLLNS